MRALFLRRIAFFCLPVMLFLASSTGVVVYAGELMPLREVALLQAGKTSVLYGRAYRVNYFAYKLIAAQMRRPKVLVLGSSHVMQIRSQFFNKQPTTFYNAGGAIHNLTEIQEFLKYLVPGQTPEVLIVGLDQAWFNGHGAAGFSERRVGDPIDEEYWPPTDRLMNMSKAAFSDVLAGKIPIGGLLNRSEPAYRVQAIGLNAIVHGTGFRNDGSLQWGPGLTGLPPLADRLKPGIDQMNANTFYYSRSEQIVDSRIHEVETLLKYASARKIYVIGFSPPFAPTMYRRMMDDGGYQYLPKLSSRLAALFVRYGFNYFDFTDAASVGAVDDDMLDDSHPSEYVCLQLYVRMLESAPSILGRFSDLAVLQSVSRQPGINRFDLFADAVKQSP
jgi:hypothetical protein